MQSEIFNTLWKFYIDYKFISSIERWIAAFFISLVTVFIKKWHPFIASFAIVYIAKVASKKKWLKTNSHLYMTKIRTECYIVQEKHRKCIKNLMRKADQLVKIMNINVYLIIYCNRKYQIYRSTDQSEQSLSKKEMVTH